MCYPPQAFNDDIRGTGTNAAAGEARPVATWCLCVCLPGRVETGLLEASACARFLGQRLQTELSRGLAPRLSAPVLY